MSPQILILPESSPNIYHFLAEGRHLQKNIGPVEDSMSYAYFPYQVSTLNLTSFNGKNIKIPQIWVEIIGKIPLIDFYRLHKDSKEQDAGQRGRQLLFGDCME
jgi:hypothetical protein